MYTFVFVPEDYKPESRTVTLHGPTSYRGTVKLLSKATGKEKLYSYDKEATDEEYMVNEGWDGEQYLAIYVNHQTNTTLRVWDTPYDNWEI